MSRMGGFDLVIELSREGLIELVARNLRLAGTELRPPSEVVQQVPGEQGGGVLSFTLAGIDVVVRGGAGHAIEIVLMLERLSLVGRRGERDRTGLEGRLVVRSALELRPGPADPTRRLLVVRLAGATAVAAIPGDSVLALLLGTAVTEQLRPGRMVTDPVIELPVRVDPSAPPSLTPLVVRTLDLNSVADPVPARQSIALVGQMFSWEPGNPAERTASCVPPGDDAALMLSPAVFHNLVFCPTIQQALRVAAPELLPATCGRAESVPLPDFPEVSVTRVADTVGAGRIDVEFAGRLARGDTTVEFALSGALTLSASGDTIRPGWTPAGATSGLTFGPGHWALLIAFPAYFWMMFAASAGASGAAPQIAGRADIGSRLGDISLATLTRALDAALSRVAIMPSDVQVSLRFRRPPARSATATLALEATVMDLKVAEVASGTHVSTGCPEGTYAWTRRRRVQRLHVVPRPVFVARPVRYRWEIGLGPQPPVELSGTGGELTREVEVDVAGIPASRERRTVTLAWQVDAEGALTVSNRPEDGSFPVGVWCTATDAEGRVASNGTYGAFAGDAIELEEAYARDVLDCARRVREDIDRVRAMDGRGLEQLPLPEWVLAHWPRPDDLRRFAIAALALGKDGEQLLANAELAFGADTLISAFADEYEQSSALAKALLSRGEF